MSLNNDNEKDLLLNDDDNLLSDNDTSNDSLLSDDNNEDVSLLDENNNENLEDTLLSDSSEVKENSNSEINEIAEANESLATMDSDPYNLIKDVNLTLSKIEKKIDKDSDQLSKLDQLEEIKNELKKMNNSNKVEEASNDNEEEVNAPRGDNLPDNSDLIVQIENLQEKIRDLETTNESYQERFISIDETLDRFKEIEKELEVEVIEEDESSNKKEVKSTNQKPQNKNLLILLIILLFTISGVIVLDALGIVNFYISEALKNIF